MRFHSVRGSGQSGCVRAEWIDWYIGFAWRRDTSSSHCSIQQRRGHRTASLLLRGNGPTALLASPVRTSGVRPSRGLTPRCATRLMRAFAARRNGARQLSTLCVLRGFRAVIGSLVRLLFMPRKGAERLRSVRLSAFLPPSPDLHSQSRTLRRRSQRSSLTPSDSSRDHGVGSESDRASAAQICTCDTLVSQQLRSRPPHRDSTQFHHERAVGEA